MNDWVYDLQRFAEGDAAQGAEANTPAASEGQGVQESTSEGTGTPPAAQASKMVTSTNSTWRTMGTALPEMPVKRMNCST